MTVTGHASVALVANSLLFNPLNIPMDDKILLWTIISSVFVDLDSIKSHLFDKHRDNIGHHSYPTHTPLYWLALSIPIHLVAGKIPTLVFLISTQLHLLFDSFAVIDGIMYFWPFSKKKFALYLLPAATHDDWFIKYITTPKFFLWELLWHLAGIYTLANSLY